MSAATALGAVDAATSAEQLINAEMRLVEKRIEILNKAHSQAATIGIKPSQSSSLTRTNNAQLNAAKQARQTFDEDLKELQAKLAALGDLKKDLSTNAKNGNQAIHAIGSLNQKCQLEGCLKQLGVVNRELAKSISNITTQIVIQDWNNFSIADKNTVEGAPLEVTFGEPLDEISKLTVKTWACERGLGNAKGSVALEPQALGGCFASVLGEVEKETGKPMKFSNGGDFRGPVNRDMRKFGPKHERIAKKIMEFPDYQMKPWELLKECAREEDNSLREALYLCYEVLRYNRLRPDAARKLMDIRGDRSAGGDNAGDWYHFFGMANMATWFGSMTKMLYAMTPEMEGSRNDSDALELRNDAIGADTGRAAEKKLKYSMRTKSPLVPTAQACELSTILRTDQREPAAAKPGPSDRMRWLMKFAL